MQINLHGDESSESILIFLNQLLSPNSIQAIALKEVLAVKRLLNAQKLVYGHKG